ncbi:MAG: sugar kinase [Candidatus Omnitrophica bacterium]|nr:sugar kinase [Candidatus Omnitrophota bacterium]
MNLTIIGSLAFDTVHAKDASRRRILGGSGTYASISASAFSKVNLISVVGEDFDRRYIELFETRGINTSGVEVKKGKTFTWEARYDKDLCHRKTLAVSLNVFETFRPIIPKCVSSDDNLFLANIDPDLQDWIFRAMKPSKLIACDTMDVWINNKRGTLLKLLKKIHILLLNDEEARLLTGEHNLIEAASAIRKLGTKMVVIKKGEHGALFFSPGFSFVVPPYLVKSVIDPTGAGDTFAGGMLGYLSRKNKITDTDLRRSLIYGSIFGSFTVESFGVDALLKAGPTDIGKRYKTLKALTLF